MASDYHPTGVDIWIKQIAHGSKHNPYANDDSYCEVIRELIDNGAEYAASVNRSGVGPEAVASPRVVEALRERGFL